MVAIGLCKDYYTCTEEDKQAVLDARDSIRLPISQARPLASDRVFPRAFSSAPVLHSRLRRELLEDQFAIRKLAPSRHAEICDELSALPKAHAVHCLREMPISTNSKLSIFRELDLGGMSEEIGLMQQLKRLDWLKNNSSDLIATVAPARQQALANSVRLEPRPPLEWLEAIRVLPVTPEVKLKLATEVHLSELIDVQILADIRRDKLVDRSQPMFAVSDFS
eukprot:TRINITY_DN4171_c0_g1_i4.p1 TRINITY_DN4171_c0_g1~~TRINITY_DN4171_c0_g1_i4.p1  ORF type:complete len:222 (-),score=54.26 TRINITY_DN4171_c0_g1_i4:321-986(-)